VPDGIKCGPYAGKKSKTKSCTRSRRRVAANNPSLCAWFVGLATKPTPNRRKVAANDRSLHAGFLVVYPQKKSGSSVAPQSRTRRFVGLASKLTWSWCRVAANNWSLHVRFVGLLNKTNTEPRRTWRQSQDEIGVEAASSLRSLW
jgi:hypothetical protein